jgi:hypothetical protein
LNLRNNLLTYKVLSILAKINQINNHASPPLFLSAPFTQLFSVLSSFN